MLNFALSFIAVNVMTGLSYGAAPQCPYVMTYNPYLTTMYTRAYPLETCVVSDCETSLVVNGIYNESDTDDISSFCMQTGDLGQDLECNDAMTEIEGHLYNDSLCSFDEFFMYPVTSNSDDFSCTGTITNEVCSVIGEFSTVCSIEPLEGDSLQFAYIDNYCYKTGVQFLDINVLPTTESLMINCENGVAYKYSDNNCETIESTIDLVDYINEGKCNSDNPVDSFISFTLDKCGLFTIEEETLSTVPTCPYVVSENVVLGNGIVRPFPLDTCVVGQLVDLSNAYELSLDNISYYSTEAVSDNEEDTFAVGASQKFMCNNDKSAVDEKVYALNNNCDGGIEFQVGEITNQNSFNCDGTGVTTSDCSVIGTFYTECSGVALSAQIGYIDKYCFTTGVQFLDIYAAADTESLMIDCEMEMVYKYSDNNCMTVEMEYNLRDYTPDGKCNTALTLNKYKYFVLEKCGTNSFETDSANTLNIQKGLMLMVAFTIAMFL